ncbi:MAG TPA: TonB-dependent receptor [Thermoanaerobaculia bacterium]
MIFRVVAALLLLFTNLPAEGQSHGTASVAGTVKDAAGDALPGVTITATRVGEPADASVEVTGIDGAFRVAQLKPGAYRIEAALEGFQPLTKDVKLVTSQSLQLSFTLVPAFGETVEVTAEAVRVGEAAVLESRREAAVVSDSISAEEIRKSPDSSAAGVVERLTGVTLLGDKYVFVRGLGERYSGTTINGSTLPTTETEKRVVPLDLFPAKLLETVNVVKTYTPDRAGDFGSGVVEMTTTEFPAAATMKLSLGSSFISGTTGESFRRYSGGLGRFGNGGQSMPDAMPDDFLKRRSVLDPSGYTPQELEAFGEALVGDWTGRETSSASPGTDFSLTYGNTFGRLGVVMSAVSTHGFDTVDEVQRYYGLDAGGILVPYNDYDLTTFREHASTGLVGNFSLRLAEQHAIYLNSVMTRDASAEDRFQEGLQTTTGGDIRDYRVRYQREEIFSTRLRGQHNFSGPGLGSLAEWNVARSSATNDSDLRENIYREADSGVFELQTGFAESGKVEYFELEDDIEQAGVAYSMFFAQPEGRWSGSLKGGIERLDRTRDFGARRFRFATANQLQFDLTQTPDEIFTANNIRPNGFEIREITGVNDAYDAEHIVDAAYLMTDTTFGRWRVIGGARVESSDQRVRTFNPFDTASNVESVNESRDVLPLINLVYQLAAKTNVRFAYGRSLNRPEFRELSPFTFVEVAGGRSVAGNPDLEQATLDSFDLRWETFPRGSEVIAASAFYKRIDNPIERIIQPTTDLRQSFVNADAASLYGLELELRRAFAELWSLNVNYAWIQSHVDIGPQQLSVVTNSERPLEGQSDQVTNVSLQFYQPRWGTMFRVLGAYSGERLVEVGAFGLPDVYESAFLSFDAVVSQSLFRGIELKLAGTNLLDEKREFTQGGALQRRFDPGRKVSLSLSYTPF